MIGASLGLFFLAYQFYAIPTSNTPITVKVVSQGSPLTLVANLEKGQETSVLAKAELSRGVLLNAEIKDSVGSVVFSENFDDKILTSFTPSISGSYTLTVMSNDSGTTVIAALGYPSVVERVATAEKIGDIFDTQFSLWAYAGLGVFVGIIMVVIGAIKFAIFKVRPRKSFTNKEDDIKQIPVKEWDNSE